MGDDEIWFEMARRKVQFHDKKDWKAVRTWGLFNYSYIKHLLNSGELLTNMHEENIIVWVYPSEKAWLEKIKPLIDEYPLDELTKKAGWDYE